MKEISQKVLSLIYFLLLMAYSKNPRPTSILPGITRASVLAIAQKLNIKTSEETITLHDITRATEAFFTGTASEITPIKTIEQKEFSLTQNNITQKIKNSYHALHSRK